MRHQLKLTSGCCTQCASAACCSDVPVASSTMWKMTCMQDRAHQEGVIMDPSASSTRTPGEATICTTDARTKRKGLLVRPE